jgi:hypothetical protein
METSVYQQLKVNFCLFEQFAEKPDLWEVMKPQQSRIQFQNGNIASYYCKTKSEPMPIADLSTGDTEVGRSLTGRSARDSVILPQLSFPQKNTKLLSERLKLVWSGGTGLGPHHMGW